MTYSEAIKLRLEAERTQDPALYLKAAEAFDALGMTFAAEACRRRAAHYGG